ncbi:MAG: LemA family protein [Gammaproteobacteria bacterium]|nr:LemA family protein [Gammaproteobacteria bacterium]
MNKSHGFTGKALLGLIAVAVIVIFILIIPAINKIPTLDEQVSASWSQVLNQYQRRSDLVPNLVNTVKGFARQEKEVLTSVVEARAKVSQMTLPKDVLSNPEAFQQFQEKQSALSSALSRLLVVVERYPDLKSDKNFLALQSQLEGTENRISVARRDYIESVKQFNTSIRTIPGVWIRGIFYPELTLKQNFSVIEATKAVPKVNFE